MADEVLPAADSLAQVLTDVRRYLGWHRDVAGEELHASVDGALGAISGAMSVLVTVEGSSSAAGRRRVPRRSSPRSGARRP